MCRQIAVFANSTPPESNHFVSLETAWGPSKKHPDSLASRDCHHGGYEPGQKLCDYLLENSAAEFSTNNFRRAFSCLSNTPPRNKNHLDFERLNVKVSAYGAYGVRDNIEVTIEFKPNDANGTQQLDISAEAIKADP